MLVPEVLCGPDGQLGWRVSLPGSHPLATPAVVNGRIFMGGGFGSHEFYCLDGSTGKLIWSLKTKDDGPTAATVTDDHVAFNTESCTVYVVDASNGRVVWEKWLGDPLMAQTAILGDTLFMAYPDRHHKHWLAAFELTTGKERWQRELNADVISAPVAVGGSVYVSTLDGTVHRVDAESGEVHWSAPHRATSAPWIHRGRIYMSLREEVQDKGETFTAEGFDTATIHQGRRSAPRASSRRRAEYLKYKAASAKIYGAHDAAVGFGSPPASAKLEMAAAHLGTGHVASVWSYQGSRPEVFDDGAFCVQDDVVQRLELGTKKPLWRSRIETEEEQHYGRTLSPPAVSESRLYLTSSLGDLIVLDRETGDRLWSLNVGAPIVSQPALAEGKVFLSTAHGDLYSFEAKDTDAVGWPMWGGGCGHNGPTGSAD